MNAEILNQHLNRLLAAHNRSLPLYLKYATPWWIDRNGHAAEILAGIAADQSATVDQLTAMILENHGVADIGQFPPEFATLHDLSSGYLATEMVHRQRKLIDLLEREVDQLNSEPAAVRLAREALNAARKHLEAMDELQQDSTASVRG